MFLGVAIEHPDGGAADRGERGEAGVGALEVFAPVVAAGMEEAADFAAVGVDAGEVWPFVQIAVGAGEGEIVPARRAAMLSGDDVLDVKREDALALREVAVFASVACAVAGESPERGWHLRGALADLGAGFRAEDGEEGVGGDDGIQLAALVGGDGALRVAVGEFVKAVFVRRVRVEIGDGAEEVFAELCGERAQHPAENGCISGRHGRRMRRRGCLRKWEGGRGRENILAGLRRSNPPHSPPRITASSPNPPPERVCF